MIASFLFPLWIFCIFWFWFTSWYFPVLIHESLVSFVFTYFMIYLYFEKHSTRGCPHWAQLSQENSIASLATCSIRASRTCSSWLRRWRHCPTRVAQLTFANATLQSLATLDSALFGSVRLFAKLVGAILTTIRSSSSNNNNKERKTIRKEGVKVKFTLQL